MRRITWSEGVRSWFLLRSAAWKASSTGGGMERTGGRQGEQSEGEGEGEGRVSRVRVRVRVRVAPGGKAGSASTMSKGTWGMKGGRGFIPGPPPLGQG